MAVIGGHTEMVIVLVEIVGGDTIAQDAIGRTPLHQAQEHEAVVSSLRKNDVLRMVLVSALAKIKRGIKSTTALVVDPAAQTVSLRDDSEKDDMGRDAAHHNKPDGERDAHGGEENDNPIVIKDGQTHNPPDGSISSNMPRVGASSVELKVGTLHSGVLEQQMTTQTERQQQRERERKGKQKQRKRETTHATLEETRVTLEEVLARVDTEGASLDTLNALDAAIVAAKPVVSSCARSHPLSCLLLELLRQAEEKSLNLLCEVRAMAKAAENGNTCVVCLAAPKDSLLLPCKHLAMCAECTT
jgi:hypothetical protein